MKKWSIRLVSSVILFLGGFLCGSYISFNRAVVQSYAIGFDQGYNSGLSDASIPGATVIGIGRDGKIKSRKINPK